MRCRFLASLALLAFTTAGFGAEPVPDAETQISFEVRVVTIPVDAALVAWPAREGEVAFLTDAQLKGSLEVAQANHRINVLQAPKITAFEGKDAVVKLTDTATFLTGVEAKRVNGVVGLVPKNTTVETGLTLTLRGKVTSDRKFVLTNVGYRDVRVEGNVERIPVTTMVAPVFEGGSQGVPVPFTQFLQAPQIQTLKLGKTDLRILTGSHAVIAGPTFVQEIREEFGPPILSSVPYLNRLFRSVGISKVTMRTVLIVSPRVLEPEAVAPIPRAIANSNTLLVSNTADQRERILRLLNAMDVPPQVKLELSVLRVSAGFAKEIGFDNAEVTALSERELQLLTATLRREKSKFELMRPSLLVSDNQTGHMQCKGTTSISARATPRILPDGKVLLRVELQVREILEVALDLGPGGKFPVENAETVETTGTVANGGTLLVRGPAVKAADGTACELLVLIRASAAK